MQTANHCLDDATKVWQQSPIVWRMKKYAAPNLKSAFYPHRFKNSLDCQHLHTLPLLGKLPAPPQCGRNLLVRTLTIEKFNSICSLSKWCITITNSLNKYKKKKKCMKIHEVQWVLLLWKSFKVLKFELRKKLFMRKCADITENLMPSTQIWYKIKPETCCQLIQQEQVT